MDVIQSIDQPGNAFQVIQGGQLLLISVRVIYIECRPPSSSVYPISAQEDVIFIVLATESDLRWCHLYQLHSPFLGQAHQARHRINPGPAFIKEG